MTHRNRPEQQYQRAVIQHIAWRARPGVFAFHVPNGGWRSRVESAILKAIGTVAGVPDIICIFQGLGLRARAESRARPPHRRSARGARAAAQSRCTRRRSARNRSGAHTARGLESASPRCGKGARLSRHSRARCGRRPELGAEETRRPEQQIQRAVFAHFCARSAPGVFAFHPANGGYRRPIEAKILQGLGVTSGVPDVIAVKDGRIYALELKAGRRQAHRGSRACADQAARSRCNGDARARAQPGDPRPRGLGLLRGQLS